MSLPERLLLVAIPATGHVGAHLLEAAERMGIATAVCDTRRPYEGNKLARSANWRLRGRRPPDLGGFSRQVLETCHTFRPDVVLSTGMAPVEAGALRAIRDLGVRLVNFSTDDPWSPVGRAPWFIAGLPAYDTVFNPRRANVEDFKRTGCGDVRYLPFAFSPSLHAPVTLEPSESTLYACDAAFVGAADADREPFMASLAEAGVRLRLYGRYWDRYPATRPFAQGPVAGEKAGHAVAGGLVAPCLVRRSNRDGHSMRTFELAAMGACMAVEDTTEHRDIFGEDADSVRYFESPSDLVQVVKELLHDSAQREQLRSNVRRRMTAAHTYESRLRSMLEGT